MLVPCEGPALCGCRLVMLKGEVVSHEAVRLTPAHQERSSLKSQARGRVTLWWEFLLLRVLLLDGRKILPGRPFNRDHSSSSTRAEPDETWVGFS